MFAWSNGQHDIRILVGRWGLLSCCKHCLLSQQVRPPVAEVVAEQLAELADLSIGQILGTLEQDTSGRDAAAARCPPVSFATPLLNGLGRWLR